MATVETFESTLKDVVTAKRLSASKMSTLTDIALKCVKSDTQLVSIMYRTHKGLSSASKINSLYAFDALARAARHQAIKQGLNSDATTSGGNAATFLVKMDGVLDGLFKDMVSSDHPEAKEKTKKILDIWTKSNTFPTAVLARLSKLLQGAAEKETGKVAAVASADPRTAHYTPPSTTTPPTTLPAAVDPTSTLLALLSQAAKSVGVPVNGQTATNITPPGHGLDANQLALFQQLTQAATLGNGAPAQPIPLPVSVVPSSAPNAVPVVPPQGGPLQPPPNRDHRNGPGRRESPHDRYGPPERDRDRNAYHDDRRDFRGGDSRGGYRGGYRGDHRGGFRGRGRGGYDHYRDRLRDRDHPPPPRLRRSRSRSPPRHGGATRRDVKPYSPPRRPSMSQYQPTDMSNLPGPSRPIEPGKDEFGRDLRADSPTDPVQSQPAPNHAAGNQPPVVHKPAPIPTLDHDSRDSDIQSPLLPSRLPNDSTQVPLTATTEAGAGAAKGLDTFDSSTFNPSSPESWEALGSAWAATNGYLPSQTELMQFVMTSGFMGFAMPGQQLDAQQGGQWGAKDDSWDNSYQSQGGRGWRGGRGAGFRGRGRGGHGYGNSRNTEYTDSLAYEVPYGGGEATDDHGTGFGANNAWAGNVDEPNNDLRAASQEASEGMVVDGANEGGRMQKVGDKWVFVRNETAEVA